MQTAKLGLSGKVFAQLERIFNRVQTRSLKLDISASPTPLRGPSASVHGLTLKMESHSSADILEPLTPLSCHSIAPGALEVPSRHIPCWEQPVTVHSSGDLTLTDTFSRYIDFALKTPPTLHVLNCRPAPSSIRTSQLEIHALTRKPLSHVLAFSLKGEASRHATHLPGQIPVTRQPMIKDWIPKGELRICWRKAVLKTKRSPQELKMLGFFPGIPLSQIRQIEFSHSPVLVRYWLNDKPSKKGTLSALSLFHSIPDHLFFLTSSQDE